MSNWSLRNDHEVSVVTLMMVLYRGRDDGGSGGQLQFPPGLIVNESVIFPAASTTK